MGKLCENILLTAADFCELQVSILQEHSRGAIENSAFFCRISPSVIIGTNQIFATEARIEYCNEHKINLAKRLGSGGALYLDEGIFTFSAVLPRNLLGNSFEAIMCNFAQKIIGALKNFGILTKFKLPNDIETKNGQKIATLSIAFNGNSALLFATIIDNLDLQNAMQALLIPTEKLTKTGLEHAKERMTSLSEICGEIDEEKLENAILTQFEEYKLQVINSLKPNSQSSKNLQIEIDNSYFETRDKVLGGTLRLYLKLDEDEFIENCILTSDAHFTPANYLSELAQVLIGVSIFDLENVTIEFCDKNAFDGINISPNDLVVLVARALGKYQLGKDLSFKNAQLSGIMLAKTDNPKAALTNASVVLVPYCAKPNWCKWRHTIDCVECGKCEVSDAYRMARERNMEVISIINFEHLSEVLNKMREIGVKSYVGMCCGEFFLKRHSAFRESGMDAVLMDIIGATCYELKQENLAYQGQFKAEAKIDAITLAKIMDEVPMCSKKPCIAGSGLRPHEKVAAKNACHLCK